MATLDTNVLVRYIIADDRKQFELARTLIEGAIRNERLFQPISVTVELEWVLRSRYGLSKSETVLILNRLLESGEIDFQDEPSIEIALNQYAESNADFADCLHLAIAFSNNQLPMVTFDRKASRLPGASLLGS